MISFILKQYNILWHYCTYSIVGSPWYSCPGCHRRCSSWWTPVLCSHSLPLPSAETSPGGHQWVGENDQQQTGPASKVWSTFHCKNDMVVLTIYNLVIPACLTCNTIPTRLVIGYIHNYSHWKESLKYVCNNINYTNNSKFKWLHLQATSLL